MGGQQSQQLKKKSAVSRVSFSKGKSVVAARTAGLMEGSWALPGAPGMGAREGLAAPGGGDGFGLVNLSAGVTFAAACVVATSSITAAGMADGELHMLAAVGEGEGHNEVRAAPSAPTYPHRARVFCTHPLHSCTLPCIPFIILPYFF